MRTSSLARLVMASLGVSVVITLGCVPPPPAPSPAATPTPISVSISPTGGPSAGATVAKITRTGPGTGFQPGATVTVGGSRVDATILSAETISLVMPAHAAGTVQVIVTNPLPLSQEPFRVSVWYSYADPPVIRELIPNTGSSVGGTPLIITGPSLCCMEVTVTVDGIVVRDAESGWPEDFIYLTTPAHAAGPVEVRVADRYGQSASAMFTYASPATFDFNGDWLGWAQDVAAAPGSVNEWARLGLTIRDNIVVSVLCSVCRAGENCGIVTAPILTLDPPPVVANGEFSFAGSGGDSITGNILSPRSASGSITMASCGSRRWGAEKKQ